MSGIGAWDYRIFRTGLLRFLRAQGVTEAGRQKAVLFADSNSVRSGAVGHAIDLWYDQFAAASKIDMTSYATSGQPISNFIGSPNM